MFIAEVVLVIERRTVFCSVRSCFRSFRLSCRSCRTFLVFIILGFSVGVVNFGL